MTASVRRRRQRRVGVLALALGAVLVAVSAGAGEVPPELTRRVRDEGRVRVIARLAIPAAPEARLAARDAAIQRTAIRLAGDRVFQRLGGEGRAELRAQRLDPLPFVALTVDAADLDALAASPDVLGVEVDRILHPTLDVSVPLIEGDETQAAGWDGSGQTVAVLDTGVDAAHPFLQGAVVAEACFSNGRDCPGGGKTQYGAGAAAPCTYANRCFHGTHVAGIAVGAGAGLAGVAPGASLIAVQIFSRGQAAQCAGAGEDPCAIAYTSDMIAGLNHVYALRTSYTIAAVNLSLGTGQYSSPSSCDAANGATKAAIDNLRAAGIATVASAGNDGYDDALAAPACISTAISVGATYETELVWGPSNSASFLSLLAPGTSILSSMPGGGYASKTGTSMAAPHVTGALAAIRGAAPGADVTLLLDALQATGTPIYDYFSQITTPRINVAQALRDLVAKCSNGFDDDGDGAIDWDGGPLGATPDPNCGSPADDKESPGRCGLGAELALLLPLLEALRRLRRA